MRRLILASGSPRRAELLRNAGIEFYAVPANLGEEQLPGEAPLDYCRRVAGEKARAVARQFPSEPVLGADTIVVLDGDILGKPRDAAEVHAMLCRLSGRTHEVMTGVCLIANGREQVEAETTRVEMIEISDQEIAAYAASGEPMDKAGAYAIQGAAGRWIPRVEGCYFNVMGLPVQRMYKMLKAAGFL